MWSTSGTQNFLRLTQWASELWTVQPNSVPSNLSHYLSRAEYLNLMKRIPQSQRNVSQKSQWRLHRHKSFLARNKLLQRERAIRKLQGRCLFTHFTSVKTVSLTPLNPRSTLKIISSRYKNLLKNLQKGYKNSSSCIMIAYLERVNWILTELLGHKGHQEISGTKHPKSASKIFQNQLKKSIISFLARTNGRLYLVFAINFLANSWVKNYL